ncbi:MAG: formyltransferase family protein [Thermomicrobium sp.]
MSKPSRFPRVVLWGSVSRQTAVTLLALLQAKIPVQGLIVAGTPLQHPIPSAVPLTPWHANPYIIASRSNIPIVTINRRSTLYELTNDTQLFAELGLVSCFPWKLPKELVASYPRGMLNIHPSPLPAYRGPAPLFWQYRDGCLVTGVTLHSITEQLDSGPLLAQVRCTLPLAFPGDRLEAWLAWYGVGLLLQVLREEHLARTALATSVSPGWAPLPGPEESTIDWTWSCWRAAHFLAGVVPLGYNVTICDRHGQNWHVERFLTWSSRPLAPSQGSARVVSLEFADGYLTVQARSLYSVERPRRSVRRQ